MRKWMIVFLAAAWIGAGCAEAASVLAQVGYTIQRSDSTKPGAHNEFTGGTHTFYPELDRRDSWLEQHVEKLRTMRSYKRGWTRVFFDWPQRVREIVIRRASVKNGDFRGGWIRVAIKTPRGKWVQVYARKDHDIRKPVVIRKGLGRPVKGVRIEFRTPHALTLGPVEVR